MSAVVHPEDYENFGKFIKEEDNDTTKKRCLIGDDHAYGTSNPKNPTHGPALMGWVCPVCGRGLSPYISICPCAYKEAIDKDWKVTC